MSIMTHKGLYNYHESVSRTLPSNIEAHGQLKRDGKANSNGCLHQFPIHQIARFAEIDLTNLDQQPERRLLIERLLKHA